MSDQPNLTPDQSQEPLIPPQYMLYLAVLGFVVALIVLFTQPTFTVVGYGALAFGVLALVAWVLMAPEQAKAVLTGRTARFGGTSLVVTVVLLVALIAVYTVIRNQKWQLDLTERNNFSLNDQSRAAIAGLGADPTTPKVKLLAFYGSSQAGRRDQDTLLFDDYKTTSSGKVDYEFIDPDRNPQMLDQYKATRPGQIAVVALKDDGEPDVENAELVTVVAQEQLTNAILKVSAGGDFRAYFLNVEGGLSIESGGQNGSMSVLNDNLVKRYDWKTQQVSIISLTSPQSEIKLNDPNADGEVVIIPGGTKPLTDDEMQFIADYVSKGGDLIIFAGSSLNPDGTSLASADNMTRFLSENFGVSFNNDVILDQVQSFQSALIPFAVDLDSSSFITTNGIARGQTALVFELAHSLDVADTPPANVRVVRLARSSENAYAKSDFAALLQSDSDAVAAAVAQTDADPKGPFVMAASAENTETGARVVLFGSTSIGLDDYALFQQVGNLSASFNSLIWATNFNDFFSQITIIPEQRPQDQPIFADEQSLRNINFITVIVLPFGVLLIGVWVWWSNRERERAPR